MILSQIVVILFCSKINVHKFNASEVIQYTFLLDNRTQNYGNAKYWSSKAKLTNYCNMWSGFIVRFENVSFPNHENFQISEDP